MSEMIDVSSIVSTFVSRFPCPVTDLSVHAVKLSMMSCAIPKIDPASSGAISIISCA